MCIIKKMITKKMQCKYSLINSTISFNLSIFVLDRLNRRCSLSVSWWHLGHNISPFVLFLKLFLRFNVLVLSLNIIDASDHVNEMIYYSLFGSSLYLFRVVN